VRQRLKSLWFRLLGKDPEAVVVSFWSGDDALARRMTEEIRALVPERRHFVVTVGRHEAPGTTVIELEPGSAWELFRRLRRPFRTLRVGLGPVLFTAEPHPLRLAAFLLAPRKILAYNARLERHHLRLSTCVASLLFLRGVPMDRIFLRPWWLWPGKRDRSVIPSEYQVLNGRPLSLERRRVAVLSPYFPFPLSHGGAVRIFHLLREAAREFDLFLFAFAEGEHEHGPVLDFCSKVVLVKKPRYREPRWSSLLPPEVCEYRSPVMRRLLDQISKEYGIDLRQVEYTYLAPYGGDVLVEHDVTFDLFGQVLWRTPALAARWDHWRWKRFESRVLRRFRRVVAMSGKDAKLLGGANRVRVIENGVDLQRFRPEAGPANTQRLLFVGSFRHFPNVEAYRFFADQIWSQLRARFPQMTLTVVAGPDHLVYWREFTRELVPPEDDRIRLLGFVRDVRPLYVEANLVIVPTTVSAGTNVKVLEAMAMERAVVSTTCGIAGLGLEHGVNVWVADDPTDFAEGVARLIENPDQRRRIARAARLHAERYFDWKALGEKQRMLWRELLGDACVAPTDQAAS
jgi:glycosyltransferase involved in cell wall biosynthesis